MGTEQRGWRTGSHGEVGMRSAGASVGAKVCWAHKAAAGQEHHDGQGPERCFPMPSLGLSLPLLLPPFSWHLCLQSIFWGPPVPQYTHFRRFSRELGSCQGTWKHLVKGSGPRVHCSSHCSPPLLLDTSPTVMWPLKTSLARSAEFYGSSGQPLGPSRAENRPSEGMALGLKELGRGVAYWSLDPGVRLFPTAYAGPGGHCYCQDGSSRPAAWDMASLPESVLALSLQGLCLSLFII